MPVNSDETVTGCRLPDDSRETAGAVLDLSTLRGHSTSGRRGDTPYHRPLRPLYYGGRCNEYTEGDHNLSRHSREDTLDAQRRMLEWFERYLR